MAQNNFNVNDELLKLVQQQAQPQRQPVLNTGLLSGTQQNFGDVLANPDQAQVNAGIAGVAALLSGRDAGTALVNSASAFGNTRQQTYNNQLAANKVERESLKDRLESVVNVGNFTLSQNKFGLEKNKFSLSEDKFDLEKDRFKFDTIKRNSVDLFDDNGKRVGGAVQGPAGRLFKFNEDGSVKDVSAEIEKQGYSVRKVGTTDTSTTTNKLSRFNLTIPDKNGNTVTQLVLGNESGKFFDTNGKELILPEGARLTTTGKTNTDIESDYSQITPAIKTKLQTDIRDKQQQLRKLSTLNSEKFDRFLTTKGRTTAQFGKVLDYAQGLGGESISNLYENVAGYNPIDFAAESRVVFEDLEKFFNKYRKEITGAAAAVAELQKLRKAILSGDLPPAQAKASLDSLINEIDGNLNADFNNLENGIKRDTSEDKINDIRKILETL